MKPPAAPPQASLSLASPLVLSLTCEAEKKSKSSKTSVYKAPRARPGVSAIHINLTIWKILSTVWLFAYVGLTVAGAEQGARRRGSFRRHLPLLLILTSSLFFLFFPNPPILTGVGSTRGAFVETRKPNDASLRFGSLARQHVREPVWPINTLLHERRLTRTRSINSSLTHKGINYVNYFLAVKVEGTTSYRKEQSLRYFYSLTFGLCKGPRGALWSCRPPKHTFYVIDIRGGINRYSSITPALRLFDRNEITFL